MAINDNTPHKLPDMVVTANPISEDINNIITDYSWCAKKPNKDVIKTIPWIELIFYQQDLSNILTSLAYWGTAASQAVGVFKKDYAAAKAKGAGHAGAGHADALLKSLAAQRDNQSDPYQNLYFAKSVGTYTLPYYSTYNHMMQNSWGENKGLIGGFVEETIVQIAKQFMPSAGILSPKAWEGLQVASIPIEFVLLNTTDFSDIKKNMELIEKLLVLNTPSRINPVAQLPPVICSARIPGIRWMPAAYLSLLQIENLGQMVYMDEYEGNIPEAYKITMNLTELIETSRQILLDKDRINAFNINDFFQMGVLAAPEIPIDASNNAWNDVLDIINNRDKDRETQDSLQQMDFSNSYNNKVIRAMQ
jgi:hypothetical protein